MTLGQLKEKYDKDIKFYKDYLKVCLENEDTHYGEIEEYSQKLYLTIQERNALENIAIMENICSVKKWKNK